MKEFYQAIETELRQQEADYKDLLQDFDFVRDLNTETARRYQELLDALPTPDEMEALLHVIEYESDPRVAYHDERKIQRLQTLKKLKSATVALEKQDINILPCKYEELDND